jgi:hypothetical protein
VRSSGSLVPSFALMKRGGAQQALVTTQPSSTQPFNAAQSESTRNESSHKHLNPALHKNISSMAKCRFRETKPTGCHGSVVRQPASVIAIAHARRCSTAWSRFLKDTSRCVHTAAERDSEQHSPLRRKCNVRFQTAHVRIRCVRYLVIQRRRSARLHKCYRMLHAQPSTSF